MAASNIVVGRNSYVSVAQADAYLGDSLRASATWGALSSDQKKRALITAFRILERQTWAGTQTGLDGVLSAAVANGGSGYVDGEAITGPDGSAFTVSVSGGIVQTVTVSNTGLFSTAPTNPVATLGGSGTGCTLNLTMAEQATTFPETGLTDCSGNAVDPDTYPQVVLDAQCELSYDLVVKGALETSGGQGTDKRRVKAGSVEVEYFRPTSGPDGVGGPRFPPEIMELIGCFLSSRAGSASGPFVGGLDTSATSTFSADNAYDYTRGLP